MKKRKDTKGRVLKDCEYQRADGSYEYRWNDSLGKRHSIYAKTLDSLRAKESERQKDISDGIDFSGGSKTVYEVVDDYFELRKCKWKTNTLRAYSTAANQIKRTPFAKKKINEITKKDAQKFFISLHKSGLKRNTLQCIKSILQPAFEIEVDDDHIRKNPFRFSLSDLFDDDSYKRPALTEKQANHYINFLADQKSGYLEPIILLKELGVRVSELCGITISDIDLSKKVVNIKRQLCRTAEKPWYIQTPKSKTGYRTIPLTDEACEAFKRAIANRPQPKVEMMVDGIMGFLFLDKNGNPITAMHIELHMRNMQRKYEELFGEYVPHITAHVFRHSFATRMMQKGLDAKTVCYVLGDNDLEIVMNTYTHADFSFIDSAFKKAMN